MAISNSVTVSIAEDSSGILSEIDLVTRVFTSASAGMTPLSHAGRTLGWLYCNDALIFHGRSAMERENGHRTEIIAIDHDLARAMHEIRLCSRNEIAKKAA